MQLDEFIESALTQIAKGVYQANVKLTGKTELQGSIPFMMNIGSGDEDGVAFDVAITTKAAAQGEGSGKFRLWVVDAATDAKSTYERENVSRVKFTVGVSQRLGYKLQGL